MQVAGSNTKAESEPISDSVNQTPSSFSYEGSIQYIEQYLSVIEFCRYMRIYNWEFQYDNSLDVIDDLCIEEYL